MEIDNISIILDKIRIINNVEEKDCEELDIYLQNTDKINEPLLWYALCDLLKEKEDSYQSFYEILYKILKFFLKNIDNDCLIDEKNIKLLNNTIKKSNIPKKDYYNILLEITDFENLNSQTLLTVLQKMNLINYIQS